MATRFNYDLIFDRSNFVIKTSNSTGIADRFFQKAQESLTEIAFPNIEVDVSEFKTGGWIFNKEVTRMLSIMPTKSAFKDLGVYMRVQPFGNLVVISKFDTVEKDFWDKVMVTSAREKRQKIIEKCKNLAQVEEFTALNKLGGYVFFHALSVVDPNRDMKSLWEDWNASDAD